MVQIFRGDDDECVAGKSLPSMSAGRDCITHGGDDRQGQTPRTGGQIARITPNWTTH